MSEQEILEQINIDKNKDNYRTILLEVEEFDNHIKEKCKNQIDIIFDPLVLELARTDKYYNKYLEKHLNMSVSEYIKIVNSEQHKEKLHNYFKNNPSKINYNNRVYAHSLRKYITEAINNPFTTKSKWYLQYLLNKWQEMFKTKPELKFISSIDYISFAFNWNQKTKLQYPTEALKAVGLSVKNLNQNDIYINLPQLSVLRFETNSSIYLYNLMYTFFHEFVHSINRLKHDQLKNYIHDKEDMIMLYDYSFYNRHHDHFQGELEANMMGLDLLKIEILSTNNLPFADEIIYRAEQNKKLHTSYSISPLKAQVTDYFDQIIESNPDLIEKGLFEFEYDAFGKRKDIHEFLKGINKVYTLNVYKEDKNFSKLFHHINYNVIKQYQPNDLINELESCSHQEVQFVVDSINFEKQSAFENLAIANSDAIDPRFYDILMKYNKDRFKVADSYSNAVNERIKKARQQK